MAPIGYSEAWGKLFRANTLKVASFKSLARYFGAILGI
jgi:hypothetical protein